MVVLMSHEAFLRLSFNDPLLCLTAFTTLRENTISMNQPKHPLAEFLTSKGGARFDISPSPTMDAGGQEPVKEINELTGLEEVNLLSGLSAGQFSEWNAYCRVKDLKSFRAYFCLRRC